MKAKIITSMLLAAIIAFAALTANADEVTTAKNQLETILKNLDYVKNNGLHIQDTGRIYILQQSTNEVLQSLNEKGLGNLQTLNKYQYLIVRFRFSTQFFEFIRTVRTEKAIADTLNLMTEIRKERGFDDEPYSKILRGNLQQMWNSLRQIAKSDATPDEIKTRINALTTDFGNAIALADQGDRPKAFEKSTALFYKVRDLYGALQSLAGSPDIFRYGLEVMGLNEFVGEYAQVEGR